MGADNSKFQQNMNIRSMQTGSPEVTMCLKTQSYDPDNNTCVDNQQNNGWGNSQTWNNSQTSKPVICPPSQMYDPNQNLCVAAAPQQGITSCNTNEDCMSANSCKSSGSTVFYECPKSTCTAGVCNCDPNCSFINEYGVSSCQNLKSPPCTTSPFNTNPDDPFYLLFEGMQGNKKY